MASRRGKEFENKIEEALIKLRENGVIYQRLYDVTMGYQGVHNPCDFLVYKYPSIYYVECKSILGNTLNFGAVTQFEDLLNASSVNGVVAGVLVWYIEHKETYWVNIKFAEQLRNSGKKSLNIKDLKDIRNESVYKIDGVTKRIYTDYSLKSFFEYYTHND